MKDMGYEKNKCHSQESMMEKKESWTHEGPSIQKRERERKIAHVQRKREREREREFMKRVHTLSMQKYSHTCTS